MMKGKVFSIIGFILWFSLYGVLLWMCVAQLRLANDPATRNVIPITPPQEINVNLQTSDSVYIATMTEKLDTLVDVIKLNNQYSIDQYQNGLADLRQETNNVIDKQNLWFSFWLGILALVGALIPVVTQLKLSSEQKHEIEELRKLKLEQEKANLSAEITKLTYSIIICKENKWGDDYIDRNVLWNDLLHNLCRKTNHILKLVTPDKEMSSDNVFYLKTILLQLHAVYSSFIPACSLEYKSRKLQELTKSIAKILDDLSHNRHDRKTLRKSLDKMQLRMEEFSLR